MNTADSHKTPQTCTNKNGLNQEMGLMKINITMYHHIWYSIYFNFDYLQMKRKSLLYNLFSYSNTVYMHLRNHQRLIFSN